MRLLKNLFFEQYKNFRILLRNIGSLLLLIVGPLLLILGILPFIPLYAQNPDAWEDRQTRLQPPEKVIRAIGLKEGMIVGEIGGVPGRGWSGHTTPQKELIEQTEKAGFSFLKVADELEKDNIYISLNKEAT